MHYPIAISNNDTGELSLTRFANQPPIVRIGVGAVAGLIAGSLLGKHAVLGAFIGAAGGYIAAAYTPPAGI